MSKLKNVRKVCRHDRTRWGECTCAWHFSFKWKDTHHRFSLDRYLDKHPESTADAEDEAAKIRLQIKAGKFGVVEPVAPTLTLGQLLDSYQTNYLADARADTLDNVTYQLGVIKRTVLVRPDGQRLAFGDWPLVDITTSVIEAFQLARKPSGVAAANRDVSLLRACFNWGASKKRKFVNDNPFLDGAKAAVKLYAEHGRSRRLDPAEATALLNACQPHLRAIVECALESAMRRGEILTLQWRDVRGLTITKDHTITWGASAAIFLPHEKTKTKEDRTIPLSSRLKAILEMKAFDPNGDPLPPDGYIFGSEIGTPLLGFQRAWYTAILKSHGHTPTYTATANLSPESRAVLRSINLHFHDLRREAASRWMDGGMGLHIIKDLLGHTNIAQTSTYLSSTAPSLHAAMTHFEQRQIALQQRATEPETRRKTKARTAKTRHTKPRKTTVGHDQTLM